LESPETFFGEQAESLRFCAANAVFFGNRDPGAGRVAIVDMIMSVRFVLIWIVGSRQ
jgi:hypothetical protein